MINNVYICCLVWLNQGRVSVERRASATHGFKNKKQISKRQLVAFLQSCCCCYQKLELRGRTREWHIAISNKEMYFHN